MSYQEEFSSLLSRRFGSDHVLNDVSLSGLTSFHIGGSADILYTPQSTEELAKALPLIAESGLPYFLMGRGSNLLVDDAGFRGVIIRLTENFDTIKTEGNILLAGGGATLGGVTKAAQKAGLTGLEFASGIPGTVGGAVYMNAGAYGGEIKDVLQEVSVLDLSGKVLHLDRSRLELGYRSSILQYKSWIVLKAVFQLEEGDPEEILAKMKDFQQRRKDKQPLEYPNCGSVFKRPEGAFAGQLIEQAGLKGLSLGGAEVSEKHAGFIINKGGATSADVLAMIRFIQDRVEKSSGIHLVPEVCYLSPTGPEKLS